MKHKSVYRIILILILFLSFFLRVYKLDSKPVWYDEAVSISNAEKPLSSYLFSPRINYKPVYFFLLNIWISVFGENAFNLRFFSLIWGVSSILLIYELAKAMFNNEVGWISAFLLGISVFHIFNCQQIRHFSLLVFLALASVICFLKFIRKNKIPYLIMLTIANILVINTHPYGFCVIIFEVFFAIFFLRGNLLRHWFFSQLILSLFVAWYLFLPNKAYLKETIWWIQKPNLNSLIETFNTFSWGGPRYGLDDFRIPEPWLALAYILSFSYLVLFLCGLQIKRKEDSRNILLLLLWIVMTVGMSFLLSIMNDSSVYSIKHLIIALPAFYIIIARGLSKFGKHLKIVIVTGLCFLHIVPLCIMYNNYFCTDWKESTEYLKGLTKGSEVVIVASLHEIVPFMYYFNDHKPSLQDIDIYGKITKNKYDNNVFVASNDTLIIGVHQTGFRNKNITTEEDFEKKVINSRFLKNKRIWLMLSRWLDPGAKKYIFCYLDKNFKKVEYRKFQGVEVYCFIPLS